MQIPSSELRQYDVLKTSETNEGHGCACVPPRSTTYEHAICGSEQQRDGVLTERVERARRGWSVCVPLGGGVVGDDT